MADTSMDDYMTSAIWDAFLTDRDRKVFKAAGYGVAGLRPERPALVLIGFNAGHLSSSAGIAGAASAMKQACELAVSARARNLPVIHVTGATRNDAWDKPAEDGRPAGANPIASEEFDDEIAPETTDIVIRRQAPSAFFNTDLMSFLNVLGADGVVLAGGQTAGALRATAIDAFSLNLRVVIAQDACFDAWESSHALTLCDLNAKYADPLPTADIVDWFTTLASDAFVLPTGSPDKRLDLMPAATSRRT